MTVDEARKLVKKKYPNRQIGAVGDEGKHFIVVAIDPKNNDEIDPYFAVDKKTGEITNYLPEDIIEFGQMMGFDREDADDE